MFAVLGRAMDVNISFFEEFRQPSDNIQVGWSRPRSASLFVLVTVSSIAIVRRGLRYELWYWCT